MLGEALARDVLHHDGEHVLLLDEVVHGHDVRVLPAPEHFGLAGEAATDLRIAGEVRVQALERDGPVERLIVRAVHDPHPPFADHRLDALDLQARAGREAHRREARGPVRRDLGVRQARRARRPYGEAARRAEARGRGERGCTPRARLGGHRGRLSHARGARAVRACLLPASGAAAGPWSDAIFLPVGSALKLATYDDLLRLPEDVRAEIIHGAIVVTPPPLPEHGRVQRSLGAFVGGPYDDDDGRGGPGGRWIMTEVDIQLAAHEVVRPDVAGWRRDRLPDPRAQRPVTTVPDWICEVVSPARPAHDRVTKRRLYASHGVPYYWIVDPEARTLEALRLDMETREWREIGAYDDQSTARIAPFDAVQLEVGRLFFPV